ncbi:MAG: hypothetical protein NVS4B7_04890 [Ktedonobacteraceae bacterium]
MVPLIMAQQLLSDREDMRFHRWPWSIEHSGNLNQPYVTAGNRVYSVASQHGEFPEIGWRQPSEMAGIWCPPMKLLDGFWFGITAGQPSMIGSKSDISWLTHATSWHMTPGEVKILYQLPTLKVIRYEYGVDNCEGMLIRLELSNLSSENLPLTLHFLARTDLRAAWLGENRLAWRDGRDEAVYLHQQHCLAAYNTVNPAYVLCGANRQPTAVAIGTDLWATKQTRGHGISGHLSYHLNIAGKTSAEIVFIIAGSTSSSETALTTFRMLQTEYNTLWRLQCQHYTQIMERCALYSDDELMDTAFGWAKANLQMLERDVHGIGRGICAGLPDFPWWFGDDTAYSALPLVATGQFELALASMRNLVRYSKAISNSGQVVHEIVMKGHVHDPGHLVEIPLLIRALYHTFCWTGDRAFLQELYDFCKRGLLDVVLGTNAADQDLCATGKGLVETRELHGGNGFKTLDIAAYTYEALLYLAELAAETGDTSIIPELRKKAARLRNHVNACWWIEEEGLFGDIYTSAAALSTSTQAFRDEEPHWPGDFVELEYTEAMLKRYTEQAQRTAELLNTERPWLLKHMIAATPMETGIAHGSHAARALTRLESSEFTGPWGLYLNPDRQPVTMTLPTGLMAVAEAQYQRMDQALAYSRNIASTLFHAMPGAFSEVSPDEGCFIQAWSSYGIIWPVVHFFFGLRPNAARRSVRFIPHLPSIWNTARLQNVRVGSATMHLAVTKSAQTVTVSLETSDPLYEITLGCTYLLQKQPESVTLNGSPISYSMSQRDEHMQSAFCSLVQSSPGTGLHHYKFIVHW